MINEAYETIIDPVELIKNFKTEKDFIDWLDLGTPEDVEQTLQVFEDAELYEYCAIIKKYITWI